MEDGDNSWTLPHSRKIGETRLCVLCVLRWRLQKKIEKTWYHGRGSVYSTRVRWQCEAQSTYIGRDETGSVYLPTQLERTLQLYW